jgi:hypothetical protein
MSRGKTTPDTPTNTTSIESKDDLLVLLDGRIRRISQEVAAELVGRQTRHSSYLYNREHRSSKYSKGVAANNGQGVHFHKRGSSIALLLGRSHSQPS